MTVIGKTPCSNQTITLRKNAAPKSANGERWVLAATVMGSSMAFIDGTVVNVALPVMQTSLEASLGQMQWVVEAYALSLAALIIVGGSLGDRWGHRKVFLMGTLGFGLASAWCGLAGGIMELIVARAFQGVMGALLIPASLALLSASFPPEKRGRAIGIWSAFTSINTAAGPVLGGWLVSEFSWRWIFIINAPLALVVVLITWFRLKETEGEAPSARLDWMGAMLITGGLAALIFGLIEATERGLSHPLVLAALTLGSLVIAGFFLVERNIRFPMMPLGLFRSRNFSGANLLTLFLYSALGGALFLLPFNLIQVQGYSPTAAGAAFLPLILVMAMLSQAAGALSDRFGVKPLLVGGTLIISIGFAGMALTGQGQSYWIAYFPPMALLGLGLAMAVTPLTATVMNAVREHQNGIASGVNNATSRIGGLLAVAVIGLLAILVFGQALEQELEARDVPKAAQELLLAQQSSLAALQAPADLSPEVRVAIDQAVDLAFLVAFRIVMFTGAGLALASTLVAGFMIENRALPAD